MFQHRNRGIIPILSSGGAVDLPDRPRSGLLQADPSHRGRKRISDLQISDDDPERGGKTGARLAAEHDDRILPVGHFLRRTRLDELPQLFNIWKGEMSIVGPRPERPELAAEIEKEIPEFCYRLKMKAGLTGYAQVYGKYNTTSYDKLKLDLTYIRNYSLLLDLKLILMTPKIMMLKESTEGVADNGKASDSRHPGV